MVIFLFVYAAIFLINRKIDEYAFFVLALMVLTLYYFFATTVHPWYIINLLPFALFSNKKYAFVWMGAAFLSYIAYSNISFKENYWIIAFEYAVVIGAICYSFKSSFFNKIFNIKN